MCYQANSTTCTTATATATYTYNGDGLRWTTTTNASTRYWVTGIDTMVLDDGGYKYVYGLGLAYAVDSLGNTLTQHTDGLGSVRAETDSSGNVVQTYGTDEFGIVDAALTSGTQPTPFQYTGEPRDSETGLVYLRARSYDPAVGRFMQADPLRKSAPGVGGWNRYAYVGNNPVNAADPSGLRTYVIGGVIGAPDPRALILLGALPDAGVQNVYPDLVQAFGSCCHSLLSQLGESGGVLGRSVNPNSDADSVGLKNLVLQDRPNLAEGEQINFIGYSGGLTVALNAASLLEQKGVAINNIVSIGGVAFRGKPGKVGVWTAVWGSSDVIQGSLAIPDRHATIHGAGHEDYFTPAYLPQTLQLIIDAGVR